MEKLARKFFDQAFREVVDAGSRGEQQLVAQLRPHPGKSGPVCAIKLGPKTQLSGVKLSYDAGAAGRCWPGICTFRERQRHSRRSGRGDKTVDVECDAVDAGKIVIEVLV